MEVVEKTQFTSLFIHILSRVAKTKKMVSVADLGFSRGGGGDFQKIFDLFLGRRN